MEIVMDGKSGWAASTAGLTLGSVFEEARRRAAGKKRIVVAFVLDGEDLTKERQTELLSKSTEHLGLLEIRTIDPLSVSLSTLTGLAAHASNLEKLHEEGASLVRSNELGKAGERLMQCVDGWDILVRGVRDIAALSGADAQGFKPGGDPLDAKIRKVQQALLRFRMAFDVRDLIRVAEISDREMRPLLRDWKGIVEGLIAHVARQSGLAK